MKNKNENITIALLNLFGAASVFVFVAAKEALKHDYKQANVILDEYKNTLVKYKNQIEERR